MQPRDIAIALAFVIVCQLAGALGALFTTPNIPAWYASLAKPAFTPPNWVFGPVWITLYALMGVAAYLVWRKAGWSKESRPALLAFAFQLILNSAWSVAFFGLRSPLGGLLIIIPLWLAIAATIALFRKIHEPAAFLLLPYIAWVTLAAALNLSVFLMN